MWCGIPPGYIDPSQNLQDKGETETSPIVVNRDVSQSTGGEAREPESVLEENDDRPLGRIAQKTRIFGAEDIASSVFQIDVLLEQRASN
jgi:hypothetical protein